MEKMKVVWKGIRPLVMHNGLMADPTNAYTRKIKAITQKGTKKMTDSDYEERDRLEWEAGLYWSDALGAVMPSDNIERCIVDGARKSRIGKDVQAAVFCEMPESKVLFDGDTMTKNQLFNDGDRFVLRKGCVVQRARIIRVRPMFPTGWKLKFTIEYDESIINSRALVKAMVDAGSLIGLGDNRPRFGRFVVESAE